MMALFLLVSASFIALPVSPKNAGASFASEMPSSYSIVLKFYFPQPVVAEDAQGDSVTMSTLSQSGTPGEPVLPFRLVKVLIPQGEDVESVEVTPGDRKARSAKSRPLAPLRGISVISRPTMTSPLTAFSVLSRGAEAATSIV